MLIRPRVVVTASAVAGLLAFLGWSGGEQASRPPLQVTSGLPAAADTHPPRLLVTTTTTAPPPPPTTSTVPPPTTTTAPPPPPEPRPVTGCAGWENEIAAHFPPAQVPKACAVMMCETGGTGSFTIHNPSSSASGGFQFLDSTWVSTTGLDPPAAAHPPGAQIAAAASLWRTSGWAPWSCG